MRVLAVLVCTLLACDSGGSKGGEQEPGSEPNGGDRGEAERGGDDSDVEQLDAGRDRGAGGHGGTSSDAGAQDPGASPRAGRDGGRTVEGDSVVQMVDEQGGEVTLEVGNTEVTLDIPSGALDRAVPIEITDMSGRCRRAIRRTRRSTSSSPKGWSSPSRSGSIRFHAN